MGQYKGPGMVNAKCPYYRSETNFSIVCDGIIEHSTVTTKFTSQEDKIMHQKKTCFFYPNHCPLFLEQELKIRRGMK